MPAVLVVLIAVDNEVADETLNRLEGDRLGSGLRSGLRSRLGSRRSWSFVSIPASASSIMRPPFLGIVFRPGVFALSAAFSLTTVLISQGSAVITPVKLVVFQGANCVLASAARLLRFPLLRVPLGPRPTADTAIRVLLVTAVLISGSSALVAPVKLVVFVVADHILASAGSVLGFMCASIILGPRPAADTAVRALTTILIGGFVALVAPTELMWFEFKDEVLASAECILGLPSGFVPIGPRPSANTAVLHLSTVLICLTPALVTPVQLGPLEGVRVSLAAAFGVR